MSPRSTLAPPLVGLRLDDLARELPKGTCVEGDGAALVSGVQQDSRRVVAGDLFVARSGARADGARFVTEALARGAVAVMAARGAVDAAALGVPVVAVDDVAHALAFAAAAVYGQPSFALDVVGITGTNGKTTTAHLVRAAIDGALGRAACGIIGTVGHAFADLLVPADHTTPEADEIARTMAAMRDRGATHVAMEVSSHALALGRVRAVHFRVAAFTNLTQDHLDFHGTMAAYGEAKAKLFTELGPGMSVVHVDDPFGRALAARAPGPTLRVSARPGAGHEADVAPRAVSLGPRGIEAEVRTPAGEVRLSSRLVGAHNLDNLLVALAVAHALEIDVGGAAAALSSAAAPPGRLERCDAAGDDVTVLVDYAHTPDALERALAAVRPFVPGAGGRLVCVFGCGGDRDAKKRRPMGRAAGRLADVVVVTTDNPRTEDPAAIAAAVADGVREGGKTPIVELDRHVAIANAIRDAAPGDLVLVAGKGHEDYQVVGTVKHPFDDRLEARRALADRRRGRGGE